MLLHEENNLQEVNVLPNSKSAIKRVRVSEKKNAERTSKKSALKTTLKKVNTEAAGNNCSEDTLKLAVKALDRAAANKLIHKNAAARKISRLTKAYNAGKAN